MNSDEPLVNLDFVETNQENLIKISDISANNNNYCKNQFSNINLNNINNQRPLSLVSSSESSSVSSSPSLRTSLSQHKTAAVAPVLCVDNTAVTSQQHLDDLHFITENNLNTTNCTTTSSVSSEPFNHQVINFNGGNHNNSHNITNNNIDFDRNEIGKPEKPNLLLDDHHSLISLTTSSSSEAEPEALHTINISEIIEGEESCGSSGGGVNNTSITHSDDIVEVSLLPETSMDSRESQPLLGNCSRDTHDMAHNNFPGEPIIFEYNKIIL